MSVEKMIIVGLLSSLMPLLIAYAIEAGTGIAIIAVVLNFIAIVSTATH